VDVHLTLDRQSPIARQIFDQVRDAILAGRLRGGDDLPSTRDLARTLGVARNTVAVAFDHLRAEGFLRTQPGVGTFVSADVQAMTRYDRPASVLRPTRLWDADWQPPNMAAQHAPFDLRTGLPDSSQFPFPTWRRLLDAASRRSTERGRYSDPQGLPSLREGISRHLAVSRGLQVRPSEIVVTNGVQQALSLVAQVLLPAGAVVAVEDPGYPPARHALRAARANVVPVSVDGDGLVVSQLPEGARLVYVTPAHQFPLGGRMSLARRIALLEWAGSHDAAVIEDDYDTDFRFSGPPIDALHSLDRDGRVIYVGSFSKTMLPSLRLGYCVVPPGLAEAMRRAKFTADWHTATPLQAALAGFLEEGRLDAHVRRMRRRYAARKALLSELIDNEFPDTFVRIPSSAGLHLSAWARSDDADVPTWVRRAHRQGVLLHTVADFAVQPNRPGLVLGLGAVDESQIRDALRILRKVIETT
jgi:GntR family transcriptional regulator / MocR family aminotransferase